MHRSRSVRQATRAIPPELPFQPHRGEIHQRADWLPGLQGYGRVVTEEVILVEVKSGSARLNHNENALKDAIDSKRARWHEYRVPSPVIHPDTATEPVLQSAAERKNKKPRPAEDTTEVFHVVAQAESYRILDIVS